MSIRTTAIAAISAIAFVALQLAAQWANRWCGRAESFGAELPQLVVLASTLNRWPAITAVVVLVYFLPAAFARRRRQALFFGALGVFVALVSLALIVQAGAECGSIQVGHIR